MLAGLIIVGVTVDKHLHWIAFIIGGALYYYMLSATTGLIQTVSFHRCIPCRPNH